jgi:hypothetical protein
VYLILTVQLWVNASAPSLRFETTLAVLIIAGTIIGAVIYEVYHFFYWCLAWNCPFFCWLWGFDHITVLKDGLSQLKEDRYRRAVWDAVFFRNRGEVQTRILNTFSAAHASATVGIAIILSLLTRFYFPFDLSAADFIGSITEAISRPELGIQTSVYIWFLVGTVTVLGLNHLRLCRDAGALENLFLQYLWTEVMDTSRKLPKNPQ